MIFRTDCRYWRGDKPCQFNRLCDGCSHFQPIHPHILIIKCRAQGDVLRTTCLIPSLERNYPGCAISWVVDPESVDLVPKPRLHRLWPFQLESLLTLETQEFDHLISLDKEPGPAALATKLRSRKKYGFGLNEKGNLIVFNEASTYALRLGVDDELKFRRNQKTYQEIIHEIAELPYNRDEYVFYLDEKNKERARQFLSFHGLENKRPRIGLNTGAGTKFETKQWPREYFLELIRLLHDELGAFLFLLGGEREKIFNESLMKLSSWPLFNTGHNNSLLEFAGFISMMDLIITSDTLGMHLAIALKKPVIALFGPTSPQEIDLYGRGRKLFAGLDCSPCYQQSCPDLKCLKAITPTMVLKAVRELL